MRDFVKRYMTMTNTGKLIKKLRLENDLSQRELATHLGFTNVFLAKIEAGRCGLPVKYVSKIARKLGVSKHDILRTMNKDLTDKLVFKATRG